MKKEERPIVIKDISGEWCFAFPPSIDNEEVYNEYYEGVELLDEDDAQAEKIFKKIIAKHPYHIDAYNHLSIAFRNQGKTFESYLTAEKGYLEAKSCILASKMPVKAKLTWGELDNRPFLRACQTYGLECQHKKDYLRALMLYSENLDYNPEDHQGIRYLILECLFALKDFVNAEKLLKKYPKDPMVDFAYGRLLIAILGGNIRKAESLLPDAVKCNQHVIGEVLKSQHKPPIGYDESEGSFRWHSPEEAYYYWKRNKAILGDKRVKDFFVTYYKEVFSKL